MVLCGHVSMSVASATKDVFPDKEQCSDSVCAFVGSFFGSERVCCGLEGGSQESTSFPFSR